uniref:Uncharacterized protein n=1 Tax=Chromera velia CCMP2878 TaxID=1169474 RepID=A0A0G4F2W7_9ALVE|eukprot:Cvel_14745.t1-p1 / transcript=Cvel_14745.t1 / gene=Cvel_14745 / organism=Chromera_velia_CCMP2878 / gene_product=hypothetical protein / transcript_product=hypothetical protein / location=Cvel_scaffold1060:53488-53745(-) / protein_length=86 / sequence_SO=supercontig / SO=protein_coding / is_pseudo=false
MYFALDPTFTFVREPILNLSPNTSNASSVLSPAPKMSSTCVACTSCTGSSSTSLLTAIDCSTGTNPNSSYPLLNSFPHSAGAAGVP